ncbi:MAG: electron transfer flavoprotein subunit alpha/FixB family protein, partial [Planctomycetes bacterium]|nr:electron transfer flavoprotein subunit alpha/FixB family protein [Planctomycetota bacterium]
MADDILIFAEQRDDKVHPGALQCVTPAKQLAAKTGGRVVACVIGDAIDNAVSTVEQTGVDQIVTISDPALKMYSALRYRSALAVAIDQVAPRIVLMATTFMGRDLSPRVAMRCKAALATDVVELDLTDAGELDVVRALYNGKATCHVRFPRDKLAIAIVRANTFATPTGGGGAAREALAYASLDGDDRINVKEIAKTGGDVKDVTEADIIVSGGRALKNEDNFKIIYELARELDAAVGASRAACDAGYQPHSRQVGLTGKTVTPKLYIACGISGAIQHLAGMRGSKTIVAINTDPEAPLLSVADYGIVDDIF